MAERALRKAQADARRGEREADDCTARALWRGGRRYTGKPAYKGQRSPAWKYGPAYGLLR